MARLAARGDFIPADAEWNWCCFLASVSRALSVSGSFTNVVPSACLALAFSGVALGGLRPLLKIADQRLPQFAKYFFVPGAIAGFSILWPFLIQFRLAPNKIHLDRASDALRDIFNASFLYRWTDDVLNSLGAVASAPGSWQERATNLGEYFLFPALFLLVAAGFFLALRARSGSTSEQNAACRSLGGE